MGPSNELTDVMVFGFVLWVAISLTAWTVAYILKIMKDDKK